MPYVMTILISLIWGTSFILMKYAMLSFGPFGVGGWRVLGAAVVLMLIFKLKGKPWPMTRKHLLPLLVLITMGYFYPFVTQPWLVSRHGSGFIGMMVSFVPLLTIIVSIPMLRILPTMREVIGVVGGLLFILLIMADGVKRDVPIGDLGMAVLVPLSYATSNTYLKRRFVGVSPLPLAGSATALAAMVLLPIALLLPGKSVALNEHFPAAAGAVFMLGVLGTGIATYMFYKLIQDHGPLFAAMVTYLIPLIAMGWGWLDNEKVTMLQIAALSGVLVMVGLVQYGAKNNVMAAKSQVEAKEIC